MSLQDGRTDVVKHLLSAGALVNSKGPGGATAILLAAQDGYVDMTQALLSAGADIGPSGMGQTPLAMARCVTFCAV